jgi:uncharacterized membrane protein
MTLLTFGVVLFALLHLAPAVPQWKAAMKARTGDGAYGMVFGLLSLVAISIIIVGWDMADFVPAYEPLAWGRHANLGLTLVAFLFLGIFLFRGRLRQVARFPMGIAVVFWAVGHLLANGDRASIMLFGGMLLYAAGHMALGLLNGVRPTPEVRAGHDLLSLMAGLALYGVMTQLHGFLIGVPVLTLVR